MKHTNYVTKDKLCSECIKKAKMIGKPIKYFSMDKWACNTCFWKQFEYKGSYKDGMG